MGGHISRRDHPVGDGGDLLAAPGAKSQVDSVLVSATAAPLSVGTATGDAGRPRKVQGADPRSRGMEDEEVLIGSVRCFKFEKRCSEGKPEGKVCRTLTARRALFGSAATSPLLHLEETQAPPLPGNRGGRIEGFQNPGDVRSGFAKGASNRADESVLGNHVFGGEALSTRPPRVCPLHILRPRPSLRPPSPPHPPSKTPAAPTRERDRRPARLWLCRWGKVAVEEVGEEVAKAEGLQINNPLHNNSLPPWERLV